MALYQEEIQTENQLEPLSQLPLPAPTPPPETGEQRRRMLIALGILLAALVAVLLKDWDFWFPPSVEVQEAAVRRRSKIANTPAPNSNSNAPATSSHEHRATAKPAEPATPEPAPMAATTQRTVLPPLEVEVVAGNQHINVPAKSNAIHLDVDSGAAAPSTPSAPAQVPSGVVSAGNRVDLSPQIAQRVTVSVPPDYPLLARQMKVQGAVSLQALISREGTIQELQILSGPAILAAAAREAVKQWHFKPYLQSGQPVETQARITVNFTISTN